MKPLPPDFRSAEFLRAHILRTMAFYEGRALDASGGFFHFFKDDGSVFDAHTRHLVSSTRFVITHAMAARRFPENERAPAWRDAARHGLDFVRDVHRDPATGGYAWMLSWEDGHKTVLDATNHLYGLAFVLLAHSHALMAGIDEAFTGIEETFELMERRFWEPPRRLYADEADAQWVLSAYRGQNANMHACEAMLAAFDATGNQRFVERAATLAASVTEHLAQKQHGLIWEHYHADWTPDWNYNRDDPTNLFRPWGFQVGHHTEWAKLLLTLERARPDHANNEALVHRARGLFACGVDHGWDRSHEGLVYGFARDEAPGHEGRFVTCDGHKYHWVQAESFAAAALLAERTIEGGYWDWYDRIWLFVWDHFVDHRFGGWYRILGADNKKLTDEKSPAGKVDYHNMGACFEVLAALERT